MFRAPTPIKPWSRSLVTWIELYFSAVLIASLMVIGVLISRIPSLPQSGKGAFDVGSFLVWNGLALAVALADGQWKWFRWSKWSGWTIDVDDCRLQVRNGKQLLHTLSWENFKGYVVNQRRHKMMVLSQDRTADFELPFLGFHEVHETTNRLMAAMDSRIPTGGIREVDMSRGWGIPKWLTATLLVLSLSMLGVPIWVLALNGFRATPEIAFEVLSRLGGLVWPCILLGPVFLMISVAEISSKKQRLKQDKELQVAHGLGASYYPASDSGIRAFRILFAGLGVLLVPVALAQGWLAVVFTLFLLLVLWLGLRLTLQRSEQRVIVTPDHVFVRWKSHETRLEKGAFKLDFSYTGSSDRVQSIIVETGQSRIVLQERWADGDWLSRALLRLSQPSEKALE